MLDQSPQKEAKQILLGTVLGDATMNQVSYKKSTVAFAHGSQQLDYFIWKMQKLQSLVGDFRVDFRDSYTPSRKEYNGNIIIRAESLSSEYLSHVFNDFYFFDSGIKRKEVHNNILNRLTPLSIAVWYMDDGCCVREKGKNRIHSIRIATCAFSNEEVNEICNWFWTKHNIDFCIYLRSNTENPDMICRKQEHIYRFLSLVEPHIVKCMWYKVDPFQYSAGGVKSRQEIVRTLQQCGEVIRNNNSLSGVKPENIEVEVSDEIIRQLAQWFDEYGNVTIYDHWLKGSNKIVLCVNSRDEQIPNSFKEVFGGSVSSFVEKRVKEPYKIFRYSASKFIAREIVKHLYPYLVRQKNNDRVTGLMV